MSDNSLRVVWVYPDLLSTYGDQGNVLVVERRARQRGLDVARLDVRSDQPIPTSGDIYLIGGGEDRPQRLAAERLRRDRHLYQAVNNGAIVFAVCAGYQILGHEFVNDLGQREPGLGLLDVTTTRGEGERCVGDVLADIDPRLGLPQLTGFENHQGVTHLGPTDPARLGERPEPLSRHRLPLREHLEEGGAGRLLSGRPLGQTAEGEQIRGDHQPLLHGERGERVETGDPGGDQGQQWIGIGSRGEPRGHVFEHFTGRTRH